MSALDERPPHVLRTPDDHYREADRLLHEVSDVRDGGLGFVKHKIALAHVHALLAQCGGQVEAIDEADFYYDDNTYRAPVIHTVPTTQERL